MLFRSPVAKVRGVDDDRGRDRAGRKTGRDLTQGTADLAFESTHSGFPGVIRDHGADGVGHAEELLFEPELVVRGSTGPAPVRV